jgi:hypothetical protein
MAWTKHKSPIIPPVLGDFIVINTDKVFGTHNQREAIPLFPFEEVPQGL